MNFTAHESRNVISKCEQVPAPPRVYGSLNCISARAQPMFSASRKRQRKSFTHHFVRHLASNPLKFAIRGERHFVIKKGITSLTRQNYLTAKVQLGARARRAHIARKRMFFIGPIELRTSRSGPRVRLSEPSGGSIRRK